MASECMHAELRRAKTGGWFCIGCDFEIPEPLPTPPSSKTESRDMLIGALQELADKLTDSGIYEAGISHASVYATVVREAIEALSATHETSGERTPKDYAIEHAGYLADAVDAYLNAASNHAALCEQVKELPSDTNSDRLLEAAHVCNEAICTLERRIHEFRKRAERAQHPETTGYSKCLHSMADAIGVAEERWSIDGWCAACAWHASRVKSTENLSVPPASPTEQASLTSSSSAGGAVPEKEPK